MNGGHSGRLRNFVGTGIINTVFGYAVYGIGVLAGLHPAVALGIATVIGAIFNYFTTARLVFEERRLFFLPRFILVYMGFWVVNIVLLRWFLTLGIPALPAQALALPFVVALSYAAMTFWVFRPRGSA